MLISEYLGSVARRHATGIATEHSYRGDLQRLLEETFPAIAVTNEPTRVACGAPDYILTRGQVPIGYIEAKDIGEPLTGRKHKEQFDRYRSSLHNLLITDYLEFHFYEFGELTRTCRIAEVTGGGIQALPEAAEVLESCLDRFARFEGPTIRSPEILARMMAKKARLMGSIIEQALIADLDDEQVTELTERYSAFKRVLIHDLAPRAFGGLYAQTIAYGLFAARLTTGSTSAFSREAAAGLIPASNPFLRRLFQHIAGYELDSRLSWLVEDLVDIFRAVDSEGLLERLDRAGVGSDPLVHFYETFLAEYDPKLRKARGVWYTPSSVVDFIVGATHHVLKTRFQLAMGLADASKITVKTQAQEADKRTRTGRKTYNKEVHRVQILDPACGTGKFLSSVIDHIRAEFGPIAGAWQDYVERDLLPRLYGFEIVMASQAVAHLNLGLQLRRTGYENPGRSRLQVYLTNSLEEHAEDTGSLFSNWLSEEARGANHVKRDTPVMVVLGNPPYSVSSSNRGAWIADLLGEYKEGLNERKLNLDDDYIKFIRYGHHCIEENGEGILAFVTNSSFLDGVTHRRMRESLLRTFHEVFVFDLHGSSKKEERAPDGSPDENVFDIQQGVSISIFVRERRPARGYAKVHFREAYGRRAAKSEELRRARLDDGEWSELQPKTPYFFFRPYSSSEASAYEAGVYLPDLMPHYNSGIQTKCDALAVHFTAAELEDVLEDFRTLDVPALKARYDKKDSSGWTFAKAKAGVESDDVLPSRVSFRPFDVRHSVLASRSSGFIGRPRWKTTKHFVVGPNLGLLAPRQAITGRYGVFVTDLPCDINYTGTAGQFGAGLVFPLYLYDEAGADAGGAPPRTPNFAAAQVERLEAALGSTFDPAASGPPTPAAFGPLAIFDWCYGVLSSPAYRSRYSELLKVDYPRIALPADPAQFEEVVRLGGALRSLHLLQAAPPLPPELSFPAGGSNVVERRTAQADWEETADGEQVRIWINDDQYFEGIPRAAFDHYIGGYQPARKWLKDRHGRRLDHNELRHYTTLIAALVRSRELEQPLDAALGLG